jgi:hypothetical protein
MIVTPFRETILKRIMKVFQEEIVRIMADNTYQALTSVQQVSVVQELTSWFHNWFHKSNSNAQICESERDEYELPSVEEGFEDVESNLSKERDQTLSWFVPPR